VTILLLQFFNRKIGDRTEYPGIKALNVKKEKFYFFIVLISIIPTALFSQEVGSSRLNNEFGFWLGASNPVPSTPLADVLDANIGGGGFYRVQWPWVFHTEFGFSFTHYQSRTTQALTVVPVYGALVYRLPLPYRVQIYLKMGGGNAWLVVRPVNRQGWDPLGYAGLEFSIQAGRRFRIGLRLDYEIVYEKHLDDPRQNERTLIMLASGNDQDLAYYSQQEFNLENGHFFHFGLMLSFYF